MESRDKSEAVESGEVATERLEGFAILEEMEETLEKVNQRHRLWIVAVFVLTSSPGMFNAFHILVYEFFTQKVDYWCRVPQLETSNWTEKHIKKIIYGNDPDENLDIDRCKMIGWNFTELGMMGFEEAQKFVSNKTQPSLTTCSEFSFEEDYSSVIREWNLVCDNNNKPHIQGSIAIGKLTGAFLFGFIADKFGRKLGFNISCIIYLVSGTIAAFAPNFWFFLVLRFFIGVAGSGVYETCFTILAELISKKLRPNLGSVYSISYPIGYMILAVVAYFVTNWRHLQLCISLPMLVFVVHWWFLPESPRWLLTQGKYVKAWNIINRVDKSLRPSSSYGSTEIGAQVRSSFWLRLLGADTQKLFLLFTSLELIKRFVITAYSNFAASLVYYILGLSADSFNFNKYMYIFIFGLVEMPGYMFPILLLIWMGRKLTTFLLFFTNAFFLLIILVIPKDEYWLLLIAVLLSRFTGIAMFGIIIIYTSELFPTTVRNAAVGGSLAISQLASISAPYIIHSSDKEDRNKNLVPTTACGLAGLLASLLVLLLPETRGRRLFDTIEQQDLESEKASIKNCCKCS